MSDPDLTDGRREWADTSEVNGPNFAALGDAPPRLVTFGAVPLSAALCRVAGAIGWRSVVVDPRERFLDAELFPDAGQLLVAWPADAFDRLGEPDALTAVTALTHAPELDDEALTVALRSPAFYVGALGSRRTQGRRRERLAAAGLTARELARLSGPAGLDLGGETVHESALAMLAEAVAALHGREGGRLSVSENAIHPGGRP